MISCRIWNSLCRSLSGNVTEIWKNMANVVQLGEKYCSPSPSHRYLCVVFCSSFVDGWRDVRREVDINFVVVIADNDDDDE